MKEKHLEKIPLSYAIFGIFAFCFLDALCTIALIKYTGAIELNPVMDRLLSMNHSYFVAAKMAMTMTCVGVLAYFRNEYLFNKLKASTAIYAFFFTYTAVMIYHTLTMLEIVQLQV